MADTTPTAYKVLGESGATLTSSVPAINGSAPTYTYTGPAATLSSWAAAVLDKYKTKRVDAQVSVNGSTATLTLTETEDPAESSPPGKSVDVKTPTLTLSVGTYARPIETIDSPTDFTKISPARAVEIRQIVRTNDSTAYAGLSGVEKTYADLLAMGITARQDPAFQATVTRYIRLDTSFGVTLGNVNDILTWDDVVEWMGNAKASYACPDTSLKWRATGVQVSVKEKRYAEVSKTFEGAYWYPEALYGAKQSSGGNTQETT